MERPPPQATRGSAQVVTEQGTLSLWVDLSVDQMEREVILYFLIWGEASNLRFVPELLCFLFEVAVEYSPSSDEPAEHNCFLSKVVTPIYNEMWAEHRRFGEKRGQLNYDDWNEAFWNADRLHSLACEGGSSILDEPTTLRWPKLLTADWKGFFSSLKKTHYEQRWWFALLAANRRIFLLHALSFGVLMLLVCDIRGQVRRLVERLARRGRASLRAAAAIPLYVVRPLVHRMVLPVTLAHQRDVPSHDAPRRCSRAGLSHRGCPRAPLV
mmetsp:Transcript_45214/g.105606  ORF Transcript_45214/g.105606 Transcript_45214/m.105606 type:complete len:269 (+) Transcript_45214:14-820(+)